jgi:A/G-specific adenine glycosylase
MKTIIVDDEITEIPVISSSAYPAIRKRLQRWWNKNKRRFPWRERGDPYSLFVAEFMLQRTQAAKVESLYTDLTAEYIDIQELAKAPRRKLSQVFSWLGLVKRAKYLHDAATIIVNEYGGQIPRNPEELVKLPGVGRYTANAIASFSFNQAYSIVDSTIARVLKRLLGYRTTKEAWEDEVTWEIAEGFLDKRRSAKHNYALLDLAALVCLPKEPKCGQCPLKQWCFHYQSEAK